MRAHLAEHGVGSDVHYPLPAHRQPAYASTVALPITERLARNVLSLPIYPELSEDDVEYVCQTLQTYGA